VKEWRVKFSWSLVRSPLAGSRGTASSDGGDQNPPKTGVCMLRSWQKLQAVCIIGILCSAANPWIQAGDRLYVICVHGMLISTTMLWRGGGSTLPAWLTRVVCCTPSVCVLVMLMCFCNCKVLFLTLFHWAVHPMCSTRNVVYRRTCTVCLPRDAMRKRGLCCRPTSVCLSLCLSVRTFVRHVRVLYPDGWKIVKLLSRPGSPMILFSDPARWYPFQREPRQQGAKHTTVGKFWDFPLKSPFISEMVRVRPMITIEH